MLALICVLFSFGDARLPERFWNRVQPCPMSGCWLWTGAGTRDGYGRYRHNGHEIVAHRASYDVAVGAMPAGLQLDHQCRVRCCVNPAHLEPVTNRENQMRGVSFTAANANKTHCPAGHPLEGDNLYVWKKGATHGGRICRTCRADQARAKRRRDAGKAA